MLFNIYGKVYNLLARVVNPGDPSNIMVNATLLWFGFRRAISLYIMVYFAVSWIDLPLFFCKEQMTSARSKFNNNEICRVIWLEKNDYDNFGSQSELNYSIKSINQTKFNPIDKILQHRLFIYYIYVCWRMSDKGNYLEYIPHVFVCCVHLELCLSARSS